MSAEAVEYPCESEAPRPKPLLAEAEDLARQLPGHRVEIIGGVITVSPSADGAHGRVLTKLMRPLILAGLDDGDTEIIQAVGIWLPSGPQDFAIPDLAVVDVGFEDHHVANNCYDPGYFRMVVEVTSSDYRADLRRKVTAYASARVPVYVIVDRQHQRLHVLTDPDGIAYSLHRTHAPGELVTLPESLGVEVKLDVAALLEAGKPQLTDTQQGSDA
ncbi:Uma2 family endonuclease [Streptomyces sp. NPDC057638]|uniref:Uma2 family endonuclease n=1 Tax=Streptomyces sp. NPDC057638 TaxID=3346190 RepID=UPI0036AFEB5B